MSDTDERIFKYSRKSIKKDKNFKIKYMNKQIKKKSNSTKLILDTQIYNNLKNTN